MIRIGFIPDFGSHWIGGANYYRSLFSALRELPDRKVEPVIFISASAPKADEATFDDLEVVRSSILDSSHPASIFRRVIKKICARDILLSGLLRQHHVDVLSHYGSLGRDTGIKTIGWIPDFQHRHLPQFFDGKELLARDRKFHTICRNCDYVLLSSEAARADLASFDSVAVSKSRVLNFVPRVDPNGPFLKLPELESKYGFNGSFFYLPNQFWAHKNHRAVIDALATLKDQGQRPLVLATGNPHDYRQPGFFDSLTAHVEKTGVKDQFKILGLVPYGDLLSLMHHSLAVINPSLCEGWSTTVEEAKAMEKQILLSDLPVHREQNPQRSIFFNPHNPVQLAQAMLTVMSASPTERVNGVGAGPAGRYAEARKSFARQYQDLIIELVGAGAT